MQSDGRWRVVDNVEYGKKVEFMIDYQKCYINYEDADFKRVKSYVVVGTDPLATDAVWPTLKAQYDLDERLYKAATFSEDIRTSINKAAEKQRLSSENSLFQCNSESDFDTDEFDAEDSIDISGGIPEDDKAKLLMMKRIVNAYFNITKKTFKSDIPKVINLMIIQKTKKEISKHLRQALLLIEDKKGLASEDPKITKERNEWINNIDKLETALNAIIDYKSHN